MVAKMRKWLIAAASVLFAVALIFMFAAPRTRSSAADDINEIYQTSEDGGFFNSVEMQKLYSALLKNSDGTSTYEALKSALDSDSDKTMNVGGNEGTDGFGEIYLTFGGIRWTAVYLSEDASGNVALTLLEADTSSTSGYWADYRSASYTEVAVPANMYATSYVRAVTLNAGSVYAKNQEGDKVGNQEREQSDTNRYARFTMEEVKNSLTDYILKPSVLSWQANESSRQIAGGNNAIYNRSNEAYNAVENTGFFVGTYGEGTTNYSNWNSKTDTSSLGDQPINNETHGIWQDDYVWLPSAAELGEKTERGGVTNFAGLWEITDEQRVSNDKEYWTRSAYHATPAMAINFDRNGNSTSDFVDQMKNVRACIHLNLTAADKNSRVIVEAPTIFDENSIDTQKANYNGMNATQTVSKETEGYKQTLTIGADAKREDVSDAQYPEGLDPDGKTYRYNPIIYNGTERLFALSASDLQYISKITVSAASEAEKTVTYTVDGGRVTLSEGTESAIKYVPSVDTYTASKARTKWDDAAMQGYFVATNADTYTVSFTLKDAQSCWEESFSQDDLTLTVRIGSRPLAVEINDAQSTFGEDIEIDNSMDWGWKVIGLGLVSGDDRFVTLNTAATSVSDVTESGYALWGRFAHQDTAGETLTLTQLETARRNYTAIFRGSYVGLGSTGSDGTAYSNGTAGIYKILPATIGFGAYDEHTTTVTSGDAAILGLKENSAYNTKPAVESLKEGGNIWTFYTSYGSVGEGDWSYTVRLTDTATNTAEQNDVVYQGGIAVGNPIDYDEDILEVVKNADGSYSYNKSADADTTPLKDGVEFKKAGDYIVFATVTAQNHNALNGIIYVHIASADIRIEWKSGLSLTYEYGHFGTTAKLTLNDESEDISAALAGMKTHADPTSEDLLTLLFKADYIQAIYEQKDGVDEPVANVAGYITSNFKKEGLDEYWVVLNVGTSERSSANYFKATVDSEGYPISIKWNEKSDARNLAFGNAAGDPIPVITVTQYALTPVWDNGADTSSYTYDGKAHSPALTIEKGSGAGQAFFDDDVDFVTDETSLTDVGEATLTITGLEGADSGNYKLPEKKEDLARSFEVTKRVYTISIVEQRREYDGKNSGETFKTHNSSETTFDAYIYVSGALEGETVTVTLKLLAGAENVINAGTYAIGIADWSVEGGQGKKENYDVVMVNEKDVDGEMGVEMYTVTPRTITVTLEDQTATYGTEYALNGEAYFGSGTKSEAEGFSFNSTTLLDGDAKNVRVALYYTTADGTKKYIYGAEGNFDDAETYKIEAELWIWTGEGAPTAFTPEASGKSGDWVRVETNATNYNYVLSDAYEPKDLTVEVLKIKGTVVVGDPVPFGDLKEDTLASKLQEIANAIEYDGEFVDPSHKPAVTLTLKETKYTTAGYLMAGAYAFNEPVAEGGTENYEITYDVSALFTVDKLSITLKLKDGVEFSSEYGSPLKDGAEIYEVEEGEFPAGEELEITYYLSKTAGGEDAKDSHGRYSVLPGDGKYYIVAGIEANDNYEIQFNTAGTGAVYSITPKAVTVTLTGKATSVYGAELDYSAITDNRSAVLLEGDTIEIAYALSGKTVGTYALNEGLTATAVDPNYTVTFEGTASYEITKKEINVTIQEKSFVYGTEDFGLETYTSWLETIVGLVGEDTVADLGITLSIKEAGTEGHYNVGSYTVVGAYDSENYTVTFTDGKLEITPRQLIISIRDTGTVYGADVLTGDDLANMVASVVENTPLATWDVGKAFSELGITFAVDGYEGGNLSVGTYAIVGSVDEENCNYSVIFFGSWNKEDANKLKAGTYTVTTLTNVTVTIQSFEDVYGDKKHPLMEGGVAAKGWYKVESVDFPELVLEIELYFVGGEGDLDEANVKNVGTYTVMGRSKDPNVAVSFVAGRYTITPKPITVTVTETKQVYGEDDATIEWTVAEGDLAYDDAKEGLGIHLTRERGTVVGKYNVTGTSANTNYTVTFEGKEKYEITKRPITVDILTNLLTSSYGDEILITSGSYASPAYYKAQEKGEGVGLVEGDSLMIVLTAEGLSPSAAPNAYPVTAEGNNPNYTYTFTYNGEKEGSYTVTNRKVTLAIGSSYSYYLGTQGEITLTLASGSTLAAADEENSGNLASFFNVTLGVYKNSDLVDVTKAEAGTYVTSYQEGVKEGNAAYYELTFVQGVYTILRLEDVAVTLGSFEAVYGTLSASSAETTIAALAGEYTVSRTDNASPWTVVKKDGDPNTVIADWLTKLLTVQLGSGVDTTRYDAFLTFTLKLEIGIAEGNWYSGDNSHFYLSVGNYAITGTVEDSNINVVVLAGTLRVTPKAITVKAPSVDGGSYGDGEKEIPEATEKDVEGLMEGDLLESKEGVLGLDIRFYRASGTDKGEYAITGSYNADLRNYTVNFVEGKYTINARAVTVVITPSSQYFADFELRAGSEFNAPSWTAENLSVGDVFTLTFTLKHEGVELVGGKYLPVGAYDIGFEFAAGSGAKAENYIFTFKNGETEIDTKGALAGTLEGGYTVVKRPITISLSTFTGSYGTVLAENVLGVVNNKENWVVSGLKDAGDIEYIFAEGVQPFEVAALAGHSGWLPVGNYAITEAGAASDNFAVSYSISNVNYVVFETAITVDIADLGSKTYGDELEGLDTFWNAINKPFEGESGYRLKENAKNVVEYVYNGKVVMTVTFPESFEVDLDLYTLPVAAANFFYTDTNGTQISGDKLQKLDAGQYLFTLSAEGLTNYTVGVHGASFAVLTRNITVVLESKEQVYGGEEVGLTWKFKTDDALVTGDTEADLGVNPTRAPGTSVGEYAITATWGNRNYTVTFEQGIYKITPKEITVVILPAGLTSVYGEALVDLNAGKHWQLKDGVLLAYEDTEEGLGIVLTLNAPVNTFGHVNVGKYTVSGTASDTNYTVTFEDTAEAYEVTVRSVTVTANKATSVYGDALAQISFTAEGLAEGETEAELRVTLTVEGEANTNGHLDVGTYSLTGSDNNGNYTVSYEGTENAYTVTKREISVAIRDHSSTYGDAKYGTELLSAFSDYILTGTYASGESAETIGLAFRIRKDGAALEEGTVLDAGRYAVEGTYDESGNYLVTFTGSYEGSGASDDLYRKAGVLNVAKKSIDLILNDVTALFGQPYDASILSYTNLLDDACLDGGKLKGLAEGDAWNSAEGILFTFTLDTKETNYENLNYGVYRILLEVSGARKDNYSFLFDTANYFVCSVGLNVFIHDDNDPENVYGTFDPAMFDRFADSEENVEFIFIDPSTLEPTELPSDIPAFTYKVSDYVKGKTLAVGRHAITAEYTQSVNYNVNIVPGTYTVYPKDVTIKISLVTRSNEYTKVYDGQDVTLEELNSDSPNIAITDAEGNLTQLVGSDVLTFTLTKAAGANAGEYPIVIALGGDSGNVLLAANYNITFETGTYIITPRPITVTLLDQSAQYGSVAVDGTKWTVDETKGTLASGETKDLLGVYLDLDGVALSETLAPGSYGITLTWTNRNYAITFEKATYKVDPREVEVFAESATAVYGDEVTVPGWHLGTVSNVLGSDLEEFEKYIETAIEGYTSGRLAVKYAEGAVASYTVKVSYDDTQAVYKNYKLILNDGAYTVTPRPATVNVLGTSLFYGKTLSEILVEFKSETSGFVNGDELALVYSIEGHTDLEEVLQPGEYTVTATVGTASEALAANYTVTVAAGTLVISGGGGIVVVVNSTYLRSVYGDGLVDLASLGENAYTIMGGSASEIAALKITLEYNSKVAIKGVGSYQNAVLVSVTSDTLDTSNIESVNGTYTVTARSITLTLADKEQIYGEGEEELTYTVTEGDLAEGDETLDVAITRIPGTNVGSYTISGVSNETNYAIAFVEGTYKITPRPIVLTVEDASSTYGDTLAALTAVLADLSDDNLGLAYEETVADLRITLSIDATWKTYLPYREGGYAILASKEGANANYAITFENTAKYTVVRRTIEIAFSDQTALYGDAVPEFFGSVVSGDLAYGEQVTARGHLHETVSGTLPFGVYTVEAAVSDLVFTSSFEGETPSASNYSITIGEGEYTVDRRPAEVVIYNQIVQYGDSTFYYDEGTAYTVSGVRPEDDLSIEIARKSATGDVLGGSFAFDVGDYTIDGGFDNGNYTVNFTAGTYTVTPRTVDVSIDNVTATYGDAEAELTFTLESDLVYGDEAEALQITLTRETGSGAGTYKITGVAANPRYSVRFMNGTYTIEKRTVKVRIDDKTSFYGDDIVELTYTLDESLLASGDDASDLGIKLTAPAADSNAGSYLITGTYESDNYIVEFESGVYLISRATNRWLQSYRISSWMEGDPVGESVTPQSLYGEVTVRYFTDSECTQEYEGDLSEAKAGTYYAQILVASSENYEGLDPIVYEFHIDPMPSIGTFLVLGGVELIAFAAMLAVAIHFGKKKH